LLLGIVMLAGIVVAIEIVSTAFEQRDARTQERHQRQN
jgi:hypothetical protein